MDSLVFKIVTSPLLIQVASLAGRRWGPAVGGWFVGLPLTSGPIAFFLPSIKERVLRPPQRQGRSPARSRRPVSASLTGSRLSAIRGPSPSRPVQAPSPQVSSFWRRFGCRCGRSC